MTCVDLDLWPQDGRDLQPQIEALRTRVRALEAENRALREENQSLKAELEESKKPMTWAQRLKDA